MPDVDLNQLLDTIIGAVGGTQWAAVELLIMVLIVLLGGGYLILRRMESSERLMTRMLDMLSHNPKRVTDANDKEKSGSKED